MSENVPSRVDRGRPHAVERRAWGHVVRDGQGLPARAEVAQDGVSWSPDPRFTIGLPIALVVAAIIVAVLGGEPIVGWVGLVAGPLAGWLALQWRPAPRAHVVLTSRLRTILAAEANGVVTAELARTVLLLAHEDAEAGQDVTARVAELVDWAPVLPPDLNIIPALEALLARVRVGATTLRDAHETLLQIRSAAQEWLRARDHLDAAVAVAGTGQSTDLDVADMVRRLRSEAQILRDAAADWAAPHRHEG